MNTTRERKVIKIAYDRPAPMADEKCGRAGYPVEKEKELQSLISIGDGAKARKKLCEILRHEYFSSCISFEEARTRIVELIVLFSRAALDGGAEREQVLELSSKHLSRVQDFKTKEELIRWLPGVMSEYADCVIDLGEVKHVDVICKAVDYIRRNYMKKITLYDLASHVQLSPAYFCAIFKAEMKCNFINYVNKIRIEMSKKLLEDRSIPLVDVANLVGYVDQSYFSKVFRDRVGISPGRYRAGQIQVKTLKTKV